MNSERSHIILSDKEIFLNDCADFHHNLKLNIEKFSQIQIDLRPIENIDISILQLLVSAHASAIDQGRKVELLMTPGGVCEATLTRAGMLGPAGQSRTVEERFWAGAAAAEGDLP